MVWRLLFSTEVLLTLQLPAPRCRPLPSGPCGLSHLPGVFTVLMGACFWQTGRGIISWVGGSVICCALLGNAPRKSSSSGRGHEEGGSLAGFVGFSRVAFLLRPTMCIDLKFFWKDDGKTRDFEGRQHGFESCSCHLNSRASVSL